MDDGGPVKFKTHHVSISHRAHRDNCPPKRIRDTLKTLLFDIIHGTGEQHDSDEQEKNQQRQLFDARLQRHTQNLQAPGMSRELEYPENTDQPNDSNPIQIQALMAKGQRYEVGKDREEVYHVHKVFHKC